MFGLAITRRASIEVESRPRLGNLGSWRQEHLTQLCSKFRGTQLDILLPSRCKRYLERAIVEGLIERHQLPRKTFTKVFTQLLVWNRQLGMLFQEACKTLIYALQIKRDSLINQPSLQSD